MKLIGNDILVRVVYGAILGIPFLLYSFRRGIVAIIVLSIAYVIQAGSLGNITFFGDLLIEDMIRFVTLGTLLSYNIFIKKGD